MLILALIVLAVVGYWQYAERIANPRVVRELIEEPEGERARRVMLLDLPSGRQIPVNYIRESNIVYAAADGGWWSELTEDEHLVTVLVRGEVHTGLARAILDDPERTADVFTRLRPNAVEGFGTLIVIRLE
ncbi:MAG: hypothetical protein H8E78_06625 [Proteobacteria bacterium]|nr:hypothetical protein [Pseudomonadota bacterium]